MSNFAAEFAVSRRKMAAFASLAQLARARDL